MASLPPALCTEEIVISGISGRFPECNNMNELKENLLNGVNMVTVSDRRFKAGIYGIPQRFGTLKELDKFDAEFFNIPPIQTARVDPQARIAMEVTYEAMLDAGVNPSTQRGSRTGVFYAVSQNEAMQMWNRQPSRVRGVTLPGCFISTIPSRIAFAFDFKGLACVYDTACSSSIVALEAAVSALRIGKCKAAVVVASSLVMNPLSTLQAHKLGTLSPDGSCKSFDQRADGFARAEAVVALYLQRASVAKRAYASIVHVASNTDGAKKSFTYPSGDMQAQLVSELYKAAGVSVDQVRYVEAHGTGTPAGDIQELLGLAKVFDTATRGRPLLVGSVKSNLGHAEAASGLCGIAKIVTMLQSGVIPGNLHYDAPHAKANAIRKGVIEIVAKNRELDCNGEAEAGGDYVGLNSFGFGGVNAHLLLKLNTSRGNLCYFPGGRKSAPKLVLFSGRTEAGVVQALEEVNRIQDPNMAVLLNEINRDKMAGMKFRGFSLYGNPEATVHTSTSTSTANPSNSIWFVFHGIGSQWPGMGRDMLRVPAFAASIEKSARTLQQRVGFDLMALLNENDAGAFENPTNCFVGIVAIQIGFVDTLATIGIRPFGMVGHSSGEMLCAYADERLNAEQTILCAYWRGQVLTTTMTNKKEEYGMAAVTMSWDKIQKLLPNGLYVACHNGAESVTVSGPRQAIQEFLKTLTRTKKVTATEVASCGVAFHSPYIAQASVKLRTALQGVIPEPKERSDRWLSSSIPEDEWDSSTLHATASADYIVNNFLSPVLFHEAVQKIPEGATIVEIGPSGLLMGLLKKSSPSAVAVVPLQARDSKDGVADFVTALGKLFLTGVNFDANRVMGSAAAPSFPVPVSTPFISPLVRWEHSVSWDVPTYGNNGEYVEGIFDVDMNDPANSYLMGHEVHGRVLYPPAGYVVLVWKLFAQMHQTRFDRFPVVFQNVRFARVTVLRPRSKVNFRVQISDISGSFEIKESGAVVCSGIIRCHRLDAMEERMRDAEFLSFEKVELKKLAELERPMLGLQLYKRLRFFGYEYSGTFRGIERMNQTGSAFSVTWQNNWIAFMDALLHPALRCFEGGQQRQTRLLTEIGRLILAPRDLLSYVENNREDVQDGDVSVSVYGMYNHATGLTKCRGIEATGGRMTVVASLAQKEPPPLLSVCEFTPYFDDEEKAPIVKSSERLSPLLQCVTVAVENFASRPSSTAAPAIIEFGRTAADVEAAAVGHFIRVVLAVSEVDYTWTSILAPEQKFVDVLARSGLHNADFMRVTRDADWLSRRFDLIILDSSTFLHFAQVIMKNSSFIILRLKRGVLSQEQVLEKLNPKMRVVAKKVDEVQVVYLIRKSKHQWPSPAGGDLVQALHVSSIDLAWVPKLRQHIIDHEQLLTRGERPPRLYLVSNGTESEDSGLLGLFRCMRKEPFTNHMRCIITTSKKQILFDFSNPSPALAEILAHDLAINAVDESGRPGFYVQTPINATRTVLTDNAFVGMHVVGDFTTFHWIQGTDLRRLSLAPALTQEMGGCFLPVDVHYVALNFKDVMMATGNLPLEMRDLPHHVESGFGIEFSGTTADAGQRRVFGLSEGQALATQVFAMADFLWDIPNGWSFEDAATVAAVYSTVYYALIMKGGLSRGDSVLIHAGAGGVGQAAIRVAQSLDCVVFTTVGTKAKVAFIRKEFPEIPESRIGSTRDTDFEMMVLSETGGRGVDVVLNSLTGEKLQAGLRCVARHGRFLEIGKVDLVSNKQLGMAPLLNDVSIHGVMLDSLWDSRPETRARVRKLVQDGIEAGVVFPLPRRVFQKDQVEPAFRIMGQGTHIGKILIQMRDDDVKKQQQALKICAAPRIYFDPNKSYIIAGGLGGVGLEMVDWMIGRYARNIVLTSRSGVTTAYQECYIRLWRNKKAAVVVLKLDASVMENAAAIVQEAKRLGPVGGFFNLAFQRNFGSMSELTADGFQTMLNPKIGQSRNFDLLTRQSCPELDHFVVFSSIASGMGIDGSSSYGMANCAMECLCERRVADGLPGKAILWGPIGNVGQWQDFYNAEYNRQSFRGFGVQSLRSVLNTLDSLLPHTSSAVMSRRPLDLHAGDKNTAQLTLLERLAHILGYSNLSRLDPKSKLPELGMDSVMAMEVRQMLEHDFAMTLSVIQIRDCTLEELAEISKNTKAMGIAPEAPKFRAATHDLFQLNLMRTRKGAFQEECVHKLNAAEDHSKGVFIICNSIEGPEVLRLLGRQLKRPAYSMQFTEEIPLTCSQEMMEYFFKKLKEAVPNGPYFMAGYSGGTYPAIELALRLQERGENEKLMLIDMTPDRLRAVLDDNCGPDRENINEILVLLYSQVLDLDRDDLERIIKMEGSTEAAAKKLMELGFEFFESHGQGKFSEIIIEHGLNILTMSDAYKPSGVYNGRVTLVRTTQNLIAFDSESEYWGLEEFCTQTPKVVTLDTTHSYLVAEPAVNELAAVMNEDFGC